MNNAENIKVQKKGNFFLKLIKSSIILAALDKFTSYIYKLLKSGFFGHIFSSYKEDMRSGIFKKKQGGKASEYFREFRYGICRKIESSIIVSGFSRLMKFLLGCRLKIYGTFLTTFGVYTAVISVIRALITNSASSLITNVNVIVGAVLIIASIPLTMSKRTLSDSLQNSTVGHLITVITGFTEEELKETVGGGGMMNAAFLLGILCGTITFFVSPVYILAAIVACVAAYLVLIKPEIGVLALFVAMPILPTMFLAAITVYTTVCYLIKLFRGKRLFSIEPVDIIVAAFALMLFSGGFVSLSSESLKPALLMICLLAGYFLTTQLIRAREWLIRCSVGAVLSATLVSLYGIAMYLLGNGYSSDAWLDSEMFTSIGRRAVATLDNPNMLGEYLILIIPIAVAMFIGIGEGLRKLPAFMCVGVMGVCLILTWSRGAWLGLLFAALLFLFMWHHRSIWLVLAGIASIPVLPSILPATIVSRFMSIGNLTDSSTSYRVNIWKASLNMIKDNLFSGIGIGEGAWRRIYPSYSYMGVEAAPHSHNLYLQIMLDIGIFGLVLFLIFIFLMYQSGFTFFSKISDNGLLKTPDISENISRINLKDSDSNGSVVMKRSKTQLRISTAGPLCGIFAVLVQGITDYAWYNYRLYLMFWLVCGLSMAYIRNGRQFVLGLEDKTYSTENRCDRRFPIRTNDNKRKIKKQETDHEQ